MSESMKERVELAARKAVQERFGHMLLNGETWIADAILDVIAEPTDVMRSQGQWAISDNLTVEVCVENAATAERVWKRMVGAAKNGA